MRKTLFVLIAVLVAASLALSACGPKPTPTQAPTKAPTEPPTQAPTEPPVPAGPPDLTGETITIYHFGDLSGPYASITGPLIHGAEDAVKAVNEAGGIYGAQLEIKFADDAGSVDEAVAAYDRFTGENPNTLLMITYGSGEAEALAQRFAEDKIVNITAGLSAQAFYGAGSGYTFGLGPIYPDQLAMTMKFLSENWATYKDTVGELEAIGA